MNLSTTGLKRDDINIELARLSVICGSNRAGKSTALDALALLFLGYVPRTGRTSEAAAILMRGDEITINLVLDDGRQIRRTITATGNPDGTRSYRNRVRCSWLDSRKDAEHEAATLGLVGTSRTDVEEMLDPEALWRITPNQRAARLQALLESDAAPAELADQTIRYLKQDLAGVEDHHAPADHRALHPLIPGYDKQGQHTGQFAVLVEIAGGETPALIAQLHKGIAVAVGWANEEKKLANTQKLHKTQARKEFETRLSTAERALPDPEVWATEQAQLEARRSELERATGAYREQQAAAAKRQTAIAEARVALMDAETAATAAFEARTEYEQYGAAELTRKRAELQAAEATLAAHTVPPLGDDHVAVDYETQAQARQAAADAIVLPTVPDAGPILQRLDGLRAELARAEASPWTELLTVADDLDALFPTQGARAQQVRQRTHRLRTLARQGLGTSPETLLAGVEAAEAELGRVRDVEIPRQTAALTDAKAQRKALVEETARLREAAATLRTELRTRHEADRRAYHDEHATLEATCQTARAAIAALERRDQRTVEALRTSEAAVKAAAQRLADLGHVAAPVETHAAARAAELEQVQAQLVARAATATNRAEWQALIAAMLAAEARWTVFAALERALQRVRDEDMARTAAPLLARIRAFFAAADADRLPGAEPLGAPCLLAGEMGWRTAKGETVDIHAISGAEWTIYLAALNAAISARRDAPLRILAIEAQDCDDIPPEMMLTRLMRGAKAVADTLTHVIVIHARGPAVPIEEWQVIHQARDAKRMEAAA